MKMQSIIRTWAHILLIAFPFFAHAQSGEAVANGIHIAYESLGSGNKETILLISGTNAQLTMWPVSLCNQLVKSGYRVIRFDNRDIGLSTKFEKAGMPDWAAIGKAHQEKTKPPLPYTLDDMAKDAVGLLDALGIKKAHIVGASMGGMIAQRAAASAPGRVASLVSIMSSSGARNLPGPRADVTAALLRRPAGQTEAALVAHSLGFVRMIESPAYPQDDKVIVDRITRGLRRAYRPAGVIRQILAIGADRGREKVLARIASPTLVLHGDADPLVPVACGEDTAHRIPGAKFVSVPGMAHDLPPQVVAILLQHILPFLQNVQKSA